MDAWHWLLGKLDYGRGVALMLLVAVIAVVGFVGCEPKTQSLVDPEKVVTIAQLDRESILVQLGLDEQAAIIQQMTLRYNAEVASKQRALEVAEADIVLQQQKRAKLIEYIAGIGTAVAQGGLNPAALIGSAAQLGLLAFGIGTAFDNRRKNKLINTMKNGGTTAPPA